MSSRGRGRGRSAADFTVRSVPLLQRAVRARPTVTAWPRLSDLTTPFTKANGQTSSPPDWLPGKSGREYTGGLLRVADVPFGGARSGCTWLSRGGVRAAATARRGVPALAARRPAAVPQATCAEVGRAPPPAEGFHLGVARQVRQARLEKGIEPRAGRRYASGAVGVERAVSPRPGRQWSHLP
jgi:hypothetical protein